MFVVMVVIYKSIISTVTNVRWTCDDDYITLHALVIILQLSFCSDVFEKLGSGLRAIVFQSESGRYPNHLHVFMFIQTFCRLADGCFPQGPFYDYEMNMIII